MPSFYQSLRNYLIILFIGILFSASSQNMDIVKENIKTLSSKKFSGRGYVNKGDRKAANFLKKKFIEYDVSSIEGSYFQDYQFAVNTFPKKTKVEINEIRLKPAYDYIINANALSSKGKYKCLYLPLNENDRELPLNEYFLIGDKEARYFKERNPYKAKGFIYLDDKQPIWSVSGSSDTSDYIVLSIDGSKIKDSIRRLKIQFENEYFSNYRTQNVWGFIEGTKYPDSIIILSAHYDHLGSFGKTIYPGANDNASGVAMVMELARYFSQEKNKPKVSLIFALFSGEEAGLKGSTYMVNNFPFPYNNVKLMINLDMVGTGSEGITIVNGKQFPSIFTSLCDLNENKNYLKEIKARGESCNSDHCPFYKKGIPSIFVYTRGPEATAYHIPQDNFDSLPLTEFADLFLLLRDYIDQ